MSINLTTSDAVATPANPHNDLMLPNGSVIGQCSNEVLRAQLALLGIPGAHTDGRNIIVARYAAMVQKVFNEAGNAALTAWLKQRS